MTTKKASGGPNTQGNDRGRNEQDNEGQQGGQMGGSKGRRKEETGASNTTKEQQGTDQNRTLEKD